MIEIPSSFNAAAEFVDRHLHEGRADRIALRNSAGSLTYRQVASLVNRTGNALLRLGVKMGERVMLLLYDSPEFAAVFFGAIKIGAVPIPVNTLMRAADYECFLNDSGAKVIVAHQELWKEIAPVRNRLPHLRHVILSGGEAPGLQQFEEWIRDESEELEPARTSKDDVAFWLYSSGSTGPPKGAVHLQHDMVYCAELYARQVLDLTAQDVILSAAKLFFAYGLGNSLYFPFRVGASSILVPERPRAEAMFEIVAREKPTLFFAVPTLYAAMLAIPDAERRYDLSSLRLCISAGEPLPASFYLRWKERFGTEILDAIGSTEVLHMFISNRPGQVRPGSSGIPVPGYDARILDEHGTPVATGEIGNLMIRGKSTCAYYWNQPEKTRETIQGEWIATGDKYFQDKEGYYWYCGRSDDMLKAGGIWVSPIEVESALIEHPAVLEAAVAGSKDREGLVKPRAWIVLKDQLAGDAALEEELKNFVRLKLPHFKCPRWFSFVPELPKTATGKIQRFKLRLLE